MLQMFITAALVFEIALDGNENTLIIQSIFLLRLVVGSTLSLN